MAKASKPTKATKKPAAKAKTAPKKAAKKPAAQSAASKKAAPKVKPAAKKPAVKKAAPVAKAAAAKPAAKKAPAPKAAAGKTAATTAKAAAPVKRTPAKKEKLEFAAGDFVVYPTHGVGQVTSIETHEIADQKLKLYIISFERERMTGPMLDIACKQVNNARRIHCHTRTHFKLHPRRILWPIGDALVPGARIRAVGIVFNIVRRAHGI